MGKISGLYKIVNKINGKFYIGSSDDLNRRWSRHSLDLKNNCHDNQHLQNAWNKYGENNFGFEIYKNCDKSILLVEEQKELDVWVGKDGCYNNMRESATCPVKSGTHRTEEVKRKISLAQKGKPKPLLKGNKWNLGRKHKQKTIEKFKLRTHTDETKKKISESSKNQEWSIQRCENISLGKLKNKKIFTKEERNNISIGVQTAIQEGRYHKNKIPLNEYENIKSLYLSGSINQRNLALKYGITPSSMAKLLKRLGVK